MTHTKKYIFCFGAFFFIIYATTVFNVYAFSDDYNLAYFARHDYKSLAVPMIESGRVIYAIFFIAFKVISNINDFVWFRILSILGIATLTLLFATHLREEKRLPIAFCIGIPLLIGCMPALQIYAAWATCAPHAWAAVLAGLSFRSLDSQKKLTPLILLIVSLFLYQPSTMMFWVFAAAKWIPGKENKKILKKEFLTALIFMAIAMFIDYIIAKWLPLLLFHTPNSFDRVKVSLDFFAKLRWFIREPLVSALNFSGIKGDVTLAIISGIFIFSGFVHLYRLKILSKEKFILAILLIPLSYLPNLIVNENWASYRTQIALTSLFTLYAGLALLGWLHFMRLKKLLPWIVSILITICGLNAYNNVSQTIAIPQSKEYEVVKKYIYSHMTDLYSAQKIYLIPSSGDNSLSHITRYDEFGLPSSAQSWVPQYMAWFILHERYQGLAEKFEKAEVGPREKAPNGAYIIDFGEILNSSSLAL
ncbi:MAG: hypothetical protein QJR11_07385 [Fulvimonas sp.]|nr:hypothetical protein [Fulvimonas sp.]